MIRCATLAHCVPTSTFPVFSKPE